MISIFAITINARTSGILTVSSIPISSMLKLNDKTKNNNNVIILDKDKTAADAVSTMKENSDSLRSCLRYRQE